MAFLMSRGAGPGCGGTILSTLLDVAIGVDPVKTWRWLWGAQRVLLADGQMLRGLSCSTRLGSSITMRRGQSGNRAVRG